MKTAALARAMFGFSLLAFGCVGQVSENESPSDETPGSVAQGLSLTKHDAKTLEGSFASNGGFIRFVASSLAVEHAALEFEINGKVVHYEGLASTEEQDGFVRVNADVAFTAAERALASSMLDALVNEFGTEAASLALFEASVPKMAYFIANQSDAVAPSMLRTEFAGLGALRNKGLGDDGITCIKRGKTMNVQYDDKKGAVLSASVKVGDDWGKSACNAGNYACMGRCSAGCGGFGGGWTLDCLEHDTCSHNLCASGGNRDANCGDEYSNATRDVFASCAG